MLQEALVLKLYVVSQMTAIFDKEKNVKKPKDITNRLLLELKNKNIEFLEITKIN